MKKDKGNVWDHEIEKRLDWIQESKMIVRGMQKRLFNVKTYDEER